MQFYIFLDARHAILKAMNTRPSRGTIAVRTVE
jgi:hypothetical protein